LPGAADNRISASRHAPMLQRAPRGSMMAP
jgi:hypothetical protein